jgi:hypothetical protein
MVDLTLQEGKMRIAFITIVFAALAFTACGSKDITRPNSPLQLQTVKTQLIPDADLKQVGDTSSIDRLAVKYFSIVLADDGFDVSWDYYNPGDYNLDGIVATDDITQLARHWGDGSNYWRWLDTSGDGMKGTADLTALAMYIGTQVTGYRVEGSATAEGPWEDLVTVDTNQMEVTDESVSFISQVPLGSTYLRIVTETTEGDAGVSEPQVVPSKEPKIYSVTPTEAVAGEPVTFKAEVTGEWTMHYQWSLDGEYNLTDYSSQETYKAAFKEPGVYLGELTVSNQYGVAHYPFTVTITSKALWSHTLSNYGYKMYPAASCIDSDGNIWAVCNPHYDLLDTDKPYHIVVTKWSPEGELLGAREWIGQEYSAASDIVAYPDGGVIIVGHGDDGQSVSGALLIKYNENMEPVWAKVWASGEYSGIHRIAISPNGDIIGVGTYEEHWAFDYSKALTVCFDSIGTIKWARTWSQDITMLVAEDVVTNPSGDIFIIISQNNENLSSSKHGISVVKYDSLGRVLKSLASGVSEIYAPLSVFLSEAELYIAGSWWSDGASGLDGLIYKIGLNNGPYANAEYLVIGGPEPDGMTGVYELAQDKLLVCGMSRLEFGTEQAYSYMNEVDASSLLLTRSLRSIGIWLSNGVLSSEGDYYSLFGSDYRDPSFSNWDYGASIGRDSLQSAQGVSVAIEGIQTDVLCEDSGYVGNLDDENTYSHTQPLGIMKNIPVVWEYPMPG